MTHEREPRDERQPGDDRDDRDVRLPDDPRDQRDPRDPGTLDEQLAKQGRRIGWQAIAFAVMAVLAIATGAIGWAVAREAEQRERADQRESLNRTVENCRSDNETRAAVIDLVRRLETEGGGATPIFPIPVPPGAGADVVQLIEYVNGAAATPPPTGEDRSATDLAKETLPRKACASL